MTSPPFRPLATLALMTVACGHGAPLAPSAPAPAVAPSPPSMYAQGALLDQEVHLDATILWDGFVHALVSGDRVFVGTGANSVRALDLASGAVKETFPSAHFPLFRKDGRLLAVTDKGLSWFALDTGAETQVRGSAEARACPSHAAGSPTCTFTARAALVSGAILVAHKRSYCNWFDSAPVMAPHEVCSGDAHLLQIQDDAATPAPDPIPDTSAKAPRDFYAGYFEGAEVHLVWKDGAARLEYARQQTKKQFPLSPRTDGQLHASQDGAVVMLSAFETVPVNHSLPRRWRMFDFRTAEMVDVDDLHAVPATPFLATPEVVVVYQEDADALGKPTRHITGYDRATGRRRWQETVAIRPPTPRPPPTRSPYPVRP